MGGYKYFGGYKGKMKTVEQLTIQSEAILRLNCPGFGSSAVLTCGKARPLTEYKVIIVNPISIVHLFEEDETFIRQIDIPLAEGLTSCKLSDDNVVHRINQHIEERSPELFQFLAEGGLLVYYLCRPFVVHSASRSMDNYSWLCGLAPDQSGEATMSEQTVRHMSTVAHGRNVDKCEAANESEFEKYLDQLGLEWNTIIRTDFLTNGYVPLALAGPKKCIAGELLAGDKGGRVIFLPAPYSPDFDRVLIDCINIWYCKNGGLITDSAQTLPENLKGQDNLLDEDNKSGPLPELDLDLPNSVMQASAMAAPPIAAPPRVEAEKFIREISRSNSPNENMISREDLELKKSQNEHGEARVKNRTSTQPAAEEMGLGEIHKSINGEILDSRRPSRPVEETPTVSSTQPHMVVTKHEPVQEIKISQIPENVNEEAMMADWCKSYWLPGMDGLFKEMQLIHKQIAELERKLATSENMISSLEEVKSTLLSSKPGDLLESCKIILSDLGFTVEKIGNQELVLIENGQCVGLVHICSSLNSPERSEIARLVESLINFWDSQGIEPKGILIACTYRNTPVPQRKEADFSKVMLDFAVKKNICLISTTQLISIYLDLKIGKLDLPKFRNKFLTVAGVLENFAL